MRKLTLVASIASLTVGSVTHAGQTVGQPGQVAGVKGTFSYNVQTRIPAELPDAVEVTVDLEDILNPPDIQFGSRKPSDLIDPVVIPWMPGEERPRGPQRIVKGNQPGRFVMHFRRQFAGHGTLRIDAKRADGTLVALQVPLIVDQAPGVKPAEATNNIAKIVPPATEPVKYGDEALGRKIYNQQCSCCHGVDVMGAQRRKEDGPALHRAEVAWSKTVEQWQQHILLRDVDRADVMAYLAPFRPDVRKVLPESSHYVHRNVAIDTPTQRKLRRLVNRVVPFSSVTLLPAYRLAVPGPQPVLIPNEPRALEIAISKTRAGYGSVVVHQSGLVGEWWITLDNDLRVTQVMARDAQSQPLTTLSADLLKPFMGEGGRKEDSIPLRERVMANDALASQFAAAYVAVRHAALVYEAEERDRSWADEPSKR